jgi:hypothetical protein
LPEFQAAFVSNTGLLQINFNLALKRYDITEINDKVLSLKLINYLADVDAKPKDLKFQTTDFLSDSLFI